MVTKMSISYIIHLPKVPSRNISTVPEYRTYVASEINNLHFCIIKKIVQVFEYE